MAYMNQPDLSLARATLERASSKGAKNYQSRVLWALQLALEGDRGQALKEMDSNVLKYATLTSFGLASIVAEVYTAAGDPVKALEWLERGVRAGDERAEWFRRDPLLAGIRNEPRFQQIMELIASRRRARSGMIPPTSVPI
jgi:hypothetical protein